MLHNMYEWIIRHHVWHRGQLSRSPSLVIGLGRLPDEEYSQLFSKQLELRHSLECSKLNLFKTSCCCIVCTSHAGRYLDGSVWRKGDVSNAFTMKASFRQQGEFSHCLLALQVLKQLGRDVALRAIQYDATLHKWTLLHSKQYYLIW